MQIIPVSEIGQGCSIGQVLRGAKLHFDDRVDAGAIIVSPHVGVTRVLLQDLLFIVGESPDDAGRIPCDHRSVGNGASYDAAGSYDHSVANPDPGEHKAVDSDKHVVSHHHTSVPVTPPRFVADEPCGTVVG